MGLSLGVPRIGLEQGGVGRGTTSSSVGRAWGRVGRVAWDVHRMGKRSLVIVIRSMS